MKVTIEIQDKVHKDFKMYCKSHKLPMNIVVQILMERFNDNERRVGKQIKRYEQIKRAKQKLDEAQRSDDG